MAYNCDYQTLVGALPGAADHPAGRLLILFQDFNRSIRPYGGKPQATIVGGSSGPKISSISPSHLRPESGALQPNPDDRDNHPVKGRAARRKPQLEVHFTR